MNYGLKVLLAVLVCCMVAGCSGDEGKKGPAPKAEKEVSTPFDPQINTLNKAKELSKDIEAQQKANQAQIDKMFED